MVVSDGRYIKMVEDKSLDAILSSGDGQPILPEHRAWMNKQIKQTLSKKASGEMRYSPLDEVRREFGLKPS